MVQKVSIRTIVLALTVVCLPTARPISLYGQFLAYAQGSTAAAPNNSFIPFEMGPNKVLSFPINAFGLQSDYSNIPEMEENLVPLDTFTSYPEKSALPYMPFVSDDFCDGILNTAIWTFNDPSPTPGYGLSFSGSGTSDAFLELSVPAGLEHPVGNLGILAPHILQPATDDDFRLEVKFESPVNLPRYQQQGILVKEDDEKFMRFEFYSNSEPGLGRTFIFAGAFDLNGSSGGLASAIIGFPGVSPLFMRVERSGDTWTVSYSFDGSFSDGNPIGSFSHVINVTEVGVYAGNITGATSPSHTAQIDYFMNLDAPLAQEDDCVLPCSISNVTTAANAVCNGDDAEFTVTFDVVSGSGDYQVINNNTNEVLATVTGAATDGTGLSIDVCIAGPTAATTIDIDVVDTNDAGCSGGNPQSIDIPECTITSDCNLITDGLVVHLESDFGITENEGSVSLWADQSGEGNDLAASGNPKRISSFGPNGREYIELDGVDDKLEQLLCLSSLPIGNADRTIFLVARYHSSPVNAGFAYGAASGNRAFGLITDGAGGFLSVQGYGGGNDQVSAAAGQGAGWLSQSVVLRGNDFFHYSDGGLIDSGTHIFDTGGEKIVIGGEISGAGFSQMDVAALLVYDRAFAEEERQYVESYLQEKYFGQACTQTCTVYNVSASSPAICDGNDAGFTVKFDVLDGSGDYEIIDVNNGDQVLATLTGAPSSARGLTIDVILSGPTGSSEIEIDVVDASDGGCDGGIPQSVSIPDCPDLSCRISNVYLPEEASCNGDNAFFTLFFDVVNGSGHYQVIDLDNDNQILASITGAAGTCDGQIMEISVPGPTTGDQLNLAVVDAAVPSDCTAENTRNITLPSCPSDGCSLISDGLVLRLESDNGITDNVGSVTGWTDLSGQSNDLTANDAPQLVTSTGTAGDLPIGVNYISFDGADDWLERTSGTSGLPAADAERSLFIVVRYINMEEPAGFTYGDAGNNQAFGLAVDGPDDKLTVLGNGPGNQVSGTVGEGAGWITQSVILEDNGDFRHFRDGALISPYNSSHTFNTASTRIEIGHELGGAGNGETMDIAAVFLYDRAFTEPERLQMENYLREKYFGQPCAASDCDITNVSAPARAICNGSDAQFTVAFDAMEGSGNYQVVNVNNDYQVLGSVAGLASTGTGFSIPVTIASAAAETILYDVVDADNLLCRGGAPQLISLPACPLPQSCDLLVNADLVFSLEADIGVSEAGGTVSSWNDQSGKGNHLASIGDPQLVTSGGPNGQPYVAFDGTDDQLIRFQTTDPITDLPAGTADRTMFLVARYHSNPVIAGAAYGTSSTGQAFGLGVNTGGLLTVLGWDTGDQVSAATGTGDGWLIQSVVLSGSTYSHYKNGQLIDSGTPSINTVVEKIALAGNLSSGVNEMDIAAVFIYSGALSDAERNQVASYIETKYFGADCPLCAISGVEISPNGECHGNNAQFTVSFDVVNGSGDYEVIDANTNTVLGSVSGTSSTCEGVTINVTLPGPTSQNTLNIDVRDAADPACTGGIPQTVIIPTCPAVNSVQIAVKVFLQGPFESGTGLMRDMLRSQQVIPTTDPYGLGAVAGLSVLADQENPAENVVDWVKVELRRADGGEDPTTVVGTAAGLVRRNGEVISPDGGGTLFFYNNFTCDYYIAVFHRNHLAVMTESSIILSNGLEN